MNMTYLNTSDSARAHGKNAGDAAGAPTIVLVGHCMADSSMLGSVVGRAVPGARVVKCGAMGEFDRLAGEGAVMLINRVPEGSFEGATGVELVERVVQRGGAARAMLVSDYASAQAEAEKAGAMPGFGKSRCGSSEAAERLKAAAQAAANAVGTKG